MTHTTTCSLNLFRAPYCKCSSINPQQLQIREMPSMFLPASCRNIFSGVIRNSQNIFRLTIIKAEHGNQQLNSAVCDWQETFQCGSTPGTSTVYLGHIRRSVNWNIHALTPIHAAIDRLQISLNTHHLYVGCRGGVSSFA